MHTAIYIRSLLHGGAEKQALLLAHELQKSQYTLLIVHTHDEEIPCQDFSGIDSVIFLKGNNLTKIGKLYSLLKKHKIINLICFLPVNNIVGTIAAKMGGIPNVLCGIRGPYYKGTLRTSILRFICNLLKVRVISNNHLSKNVYVALGFNARHISVVHNAIIVPETNININRTILGKQKFNLLSIGRYVLEKDFETLLIAIKILTSELNFKNVHLNLVGYGSLKSSLEDKIRELEISSYVELHDGRLADTKYWYLNSDLYILSSVSEGMPNTVMEAMSYKLPIVATDVGDTNYLVADDNGLLVKPKDYTAIAMGIKSVFDNEAKYQALSNRSFIKIRDGFSVQKMAAGFQAFLK